MGEQHVQRATDPETLRRFARRLLSDLDALERVLDEGLIESGVRRLGAEQELFLVDQSGRAALVATEVLAEVGDGHFSPEIGRHNLEINLDPLEFRGDCFARLERQLGALIARARATARRRGADVVMVGILPTLRRWDARLESMMPLPRYAALNDAISRLRGGEYAFRITGTDELALKDSSVMLESCTTSFQVHLQVGADEAARMYNLAQALTAPVLAAATNSPLLFGQRLWSETRIAVFQQAADTRSFGYPVQARDGRVPFGHDWVKRSALEVFREDVARFRVLLAGDLGEEPAEALARGEAPALRALRLHTGTVYRWNRLCYGLTAGRAHLRIENRVLPSGPTVVDEVANAAFWLGLMVGAAAEYGDIAARMAFDDAKSNFMSAARLGLAAQLTWVGGERLPAQELICRRLVPLARHGLRAQGVDPGEIDRLLGVIEARVASGRTGSRWLLDSHAALAPHATQGEVLGALTAATLARQLEGRPVHEWPLASLDELTGAARAATQVDAIMTTDVFTVGLDDAAEVAARVMQWKAIRLMPVEDDTGRLVGLLSRADAEGVLSAASAGPPVAVRDVMRTEFATVLPETPTDEAARRMREAGTEYLLVVQGDRVVGIVTEVDFAAAAARAAGRQPG